jgi:hypothetical protein
MKFLFLFVYVIRRKLPFVFVVHCHEYFGIANDEVGKNKIITMKTTKIKEN